MALARGLTKGVGVKSRSLTTSHTGHIQAAPTITNRLIHIDCGAGFAGPKSTVGGGLRPPPTVDLSIDVDQPVRYGGRGLDMCGAWIGRGAYGAAVWFSRGPI